MLGELEILTDITTMYTPERFVFGTVTRRGIGGYGRGWILYIPSLSWTLFTKSREIAENSLVDAYTRQEVA